MSALRIVLGLCGGLLLAACATVANQPVNTPAPAARVHVASDGRPSEAANDDMLVALAFSGGGMRASAFSYGVLQGFAHTKVNDRGRPVPLIDRVDFVTSASGGSVTAAYFGLKGSAALADFRERFLLRDAEAALNTNIDLINLSRAYNGGANEDAPLRNWLDANLFDGATLSALRTDRRPRVWINASDIYNRTPFVFGRATFDAMCSDIADYPVAGAVTASAAVPMAFAPVVLQTYPDRCNTPLAKWVSRAADGRDTPPLLQSYAKSVRSYRDGSMKYVKLLDGGLVDNFGLSGFTIALESAQTPYDPLSRAEAMRLRRVLFLVVDSGRGPQGDWAGKLEGPTGAELIDAVSSAAVDASVRTSYSAFENVLSRWRDNLVRWRCALPAAEVTRLIGTHANWNCHDVKMFVGRIGFDQLDAARAARLNAVPTRFKLPEATVDEVIGAGEDALAASPTFRAFKQSL
jgi:NTE family protein